jgi:hypothetical protein
MSHFNLQYYQNEKCCAKLIIVSLVFVFSGCRIQTVKHSPVRAAIDTNQFLRAFYFDEDYAKALELADGQLRQSATSDDLKKMAEGIKQERGALKTLRADSYLMTQGETMELFYTGEYEKGVLHHRLVLVGDASSGYRVSGVWFQADPYPENPLRRKFEGEIFVS